MGFNWSRLRRGEIVGAAGAVALAVCMFLLPWYGVTGQAERTLANLHIPTSFNGWDSLTINRWLMLGTVLVVLALFVLQGALRAPALPVSLSVLATVLAILTSLVLIDRVLIDIPPPFSTPPGQALVGAYLGLLSALVMTYGAGKSLRQEDPPDPARNAAIPTVRLHS